MAETTRSHFEYQPEDQHRFDGSLEAFFGDQGITIEISDVQAMGSYNSDVTSTVVLPRADAIRFRDWLNEVLNVQSE